MNEFLELWRNPRGVERWQIGQWSDVLPRLKQVGLAAHAGEVFARHQVAREALPAAVNRQIEAAAASAWVRARSVRWEAGELSRLLNGLDCPAMLLKGASYILGGSLPGLGRFTTDVDLLVPRERLQEVASRLLNDGWETDDPNDQTSQYYTEWLHQVPAFHHKVRKSLLDLHHTVIAPWGGHRVNVPALLAAGLPSGFDNVLIPAPLDQCLIVAAHFARSDPSDRAFRDLLDFHELVEEAVPDAGGIAALSDRAQEIGLTRALATTSHFASRLLGTMPYGPKPVFLATRAASLIPEGAERPSTYVRIVRRLQRIEGNRAALPLRVMVQRTIERRLGMTKSEIGDQRSEG